MVNKIAPDFVRIRTFVVKPGSPMWDISKNSDYEECSDLEKVEEIRTCLLYTSESQTSVNIIETIIGFFEELFTIVVRSFL